jgi:hypothetical protein
MVSDNPQENIKLIFTHIPKTAGTSLALALDKIAGPRITFGQWTEFRDIPDCELEKYNLITGHFYAFQLDRPCLKPYIRMTVLRDPIERVVSSYNFAKWCVETGTADVRQKFTAQVSIFEYVMSSTGVSDRHSQLYMLGLDANDDARTTPLSVLRVRSQQRLRSMVVAVVPRLGAVLSALRTAFGLEAEEYLPLDNVTPECYKTGPLSADDLDIFRRVLKEDIALYEFACKQCEAFIYCPEIPNDHEFTEGRHTPLLNT